jgi:hypothetical protein
VVFQKNLDLCAISFHGGVSGKRVLKPLKEPGVKFRREAVIDPFSSFFTRYSPGLHEKAHVAGGGGRSNFEKLSDFAKTELSVSEKR